MKGSRLPPVFLCPQIIIKLQVENNLDEILNLLFNLLHQQRAALLR
nr:MAG TPA: hypothetical protein [Caudoviricetes sp.]